MFSDSERHALQYVKYKPTTCTKKNFLPMALLIQFQNRCLIFKKGTFLHTFFSQI